jgi:cytochrome c oxidase subunit IV
MLIFTKKNYNKITQIISNFHNVTSIIVYFSLLFVMDYSRIMNLYGENIVRRCMHMLKRRDALSYQSRLKPYCVPLPTFLSGWYFNDNTRNVLLLLPLIN